MTCLPFLLVDKMFNLAHQVNHTRGKLDWTKLLSVTLKRTNQIHYCPFSQLQDFLLGQGATGAGSCMPAV